MPPFTAIVHAYNEAHQIERCLESLAWVDEILFVDTHSTDATAEIARRYTHRVVQHTYRNSAETKNWAIPHAAHDWLLFLDADEVVTQDLAEEIQRRAGNEEAAGYSIPRDMIFWGKRLESTYWNPNYQTRVFHRQAGKFEDRHVHAQVILDGRLEVTQHPILHYSYADLSAYLLKFNRFTTFEARQMLDEGRVLAPSDFPFRSLLRAALTFMRLYVRHEGYRDGRAGLVLSLLSGLYPFVSDAKYWELCMDDVRNTNGRCA